MANPYAAYLESRVLTASPLQLVHLAYEGAIEAVMQARNHLAAKQIAPRVQAITRAQCIIAELQASLDYSRGGDLSTTLGKLYDYMQRRLTDGNTRQIEEPLAEVQNLLETIAGAWKEIAANDSSVAVAASVSGNSAWMTADAPVYSGLGYTL